MKININKYWIGYLTGIFIFLNIFSAGVILSSIWNWNYIIFTWIYFISLIPILIVKYLKDKQEKELKRGKSNGNYN